MERLCSMHIWNIRFETTNIVKVNIENAGGIIRTPFNVITFEMVGAGDIYGSLPQMGILKLTR